MVAFFLIWKIKDFTRILSSILLQKTIFIIKNIHSIVIVNSEELVYKYNHLIKKKL